MIFVICIEEGDSDQRYIETLNSFPNSSGPVKEGFGQWLHRSKSLNSLNGVLPPDNGTWSRDPTSIDINLSTFPIFILHNIPQKMAEEIKV